MSAMKRVSYGYVSKTELAIIEKLSREERQKKKAQEDQKSAGGVVICDETKQAAESIR